MTSAFMVRQNQIKIWKVGRALTNARERHEGSSILCRGDPELALLMLQTTGQEGTSQNEEQVGQNGTK